MDKIIKYKGWFSFLIILREKGKSKITSNLVKRLSNPESDNDENAEAIEFAQCIEQLILNHAENGIDVTLMAYTKGIEDMLNNWLYPLKKG